MGWTGCWVIASYSRKIYLNPSSIITTGSCILTIGSFTEPFGSSPRIIGGLIVLNSKNTSLNTSWVSGTIGS